MIDFRAICLVLFPETVLRETPWEWDILHQYLPPWEKHQCSVLTCGWNWCTVFTSLLPQEIEFAKQTCVAPGLWNNSKLNNMFRVFISFHLYQRSFFTGFKRKFKSFGFVDIITSCAMFIAEIWKHCRIRSRNTLGHSDTSHTSKTFSNAVQPLYLEANTV